MGLWADLFLIACFLNSKESVFELAKV
jgi:hypothetical protein